mgnify:CR=1 FL=1
MAEKDSRAAAKRPLSKTPSLDSRIYATLEDTDGGVQIEAHVFRAGHFRFNWNEALELTMVRAG